MAPTQRTDYTSMEELRQRALEQITLGYKPIGENVSIAVRYDGSFDIFAANAAFELRFLMTYRTDGGHFARGLVRQSGDLEKIHRSLREQSLANGQMVSLVARLYRRANLDPNLRWVMSARFALVTANMEAEVVEASQVVTRQAQTNLAEFLLEQAIIVAHDPRWKGERATRIRQWIFVAVKMGAPAYLDLWYYNRAAAFEMVNWNTTEVRRKAMTAATNGNPPFVGIIGSGSYSGTFSVPPNTPWQNFPFREIYKKALTHTDINNFHGAINNQLIFAEEEIRRSISEIVQQIKRVGSANNVDYHGVNGTIFDWRSTAPSDALGSIASSFVKDIGNRFTDENSLYNAYWLTKHDATSWADMY